MVRPIAYGTVTRDALPDQIAARLIELITERQLKAGDRLPPERELAATMGVSRSSLREALRALAMLGVAEMRQGDGTYLTNLQPGSLMRSVGLVLALSDSGLEELFEARKLVEPGLAKLAAERISHVNAGELVRLAVATHDVLDDPEAFMWADIELHAKIAQAACNAVLERLLESIAGMGIASRRRTGRLAPVREQSAHDHVDIATAIAAHNGDEAFAAMLRHLENVEKGGTK
ncbi:FadR/GntR family transcriptional regulator [Solirubrobacter soli]|uniref:FadR/GntR family transcriptional regulator n=1 Tax=Solirubrobacter soli TaxID=363832 RepID=UPI0004202F21|nr:FadR/GntR family transcriptional regulator [Solirubrobacter soli]